jgi:membrane protein DedA with SNARE-associated domain
MTTVVASHFLTGEILTLVLPLILLLAVGIYWWALLRRRGERAQQ